jgi:hypothetical protein
MTTKHAFDRLHAEYLEMPGMQLTPAQAQRLCGIGPDACRAVLNEMVDADFLYVRQDGTYARLTDTALRMKKAELRSRTLSRPRGTAQSA